MRQGHRRFMNEFEEEAVRLVETCGGTQQAIVNDLGIGLWTLRRWLNRRSEATATRRQREDMILLAHVRWPSPCRTAHLEVRV